MICDNQGVRLAQRGIGGVQLVSWTEREGMKRCYSKASAKKDIRREGGKRRWEGRGWEVDGKSCGVEVCSPMTKKTKRRRSRKEGKGGCLPRPPEMEKVDYR